MPNTWILVADEDGARVYETRGAREDLRVVRELPPRGAREAVRALPDPGPRGFVIALSAGDRDEDDTRPVRPTPPIPPPDPRRFARELAWLLGRARADRFFHRLVLVAPPAMLGSLRRELDGPTRALVVHETSSEAELDLPGTLRSAAG